MPCHLTSRHVTSRYAVSPHVSSCHVTSRHLTLRHGVSITQRHHAACVTSRCITSHHVVSVTFCDVTPSRDVTARATLKSFPTTQILVKPTQLPPTAPVRVSKILFRKNLVRSSGPQHSTALRVIQLSCVDPEKLGLESPTQFCPEGSEGQLQA